MTPHDADASPGAPSWLTRLEPAAWLRQGLVELGRAEARLLTHERTAGVLGLRRAAGMALNAALSVRFRSWGRTYVEHLQAVATDGEVPEAVRAAARLLNEIPIDQRADLVRLTPPSERARWVEAAKTVMAHAYAVVHGSAGRS